MAENAWRVFSLADLEARVAGSESKISEFLRTSALHCAVYRLPAGARDMQAPHFEDEVYFVVRGRAKLQVEGEEQSVGPGTILYVRATAEHSFFDIEEDLTLIAVFGAQPAIRLR